MKTPLQCISNLFTYNYDPLAMWIDAKINRNIQPKIWIWLVIWYLLLTLVMTGSVFNNLLILLGGSSHTRYSYVHGVDLTYHAAPECKRINATFDSCLQALVQKEHISSYYPESCGVMVHTNTRETAILLHNLGIDSSAFTPDMLHYYALSYIWCWGQPLCDQQISGAHLYAALTKGCSASVHQLYELIEHEACGALECEMIVPKN